MNVPDWRLRAVVSTLFDQSRDGHRSVIAAKVMVERNLCYRPNQ
jgi:hypothetical protein